MNDSIIKNLRLFNVFLERILSSGDSVNRRKVFDIVKEDKRHIYEISDKEEIFEGMSKTGSDVNSRNSDSFIVMTHPKDDRYKMMFIADGKGFISDSRGKKSKHVSDYITDNLKKWFSSLEHKTLDVFNSSEISRSMSTYLRKMDTKIRGIKGENGAKMIMALIGPEQTIIANIGDLRCYLSSGYDIGQYNEEDSMLWQHYREGYFWNKDEFRFNINRDKNVLKFGRDKDGFVSTYIVDNDLYDRIYLFSRGVVEGISEDRLLQINTDISTDRVVETIIDSASDGRKEYITYYDGDTRDIEPIVHGVKDSTACVYVKKISR